MHADLTRWTFDPGLGYRSVLMQQGRVLLDAEWNEQAEITAHHDQVRTHDVVGPAGGPEPSDGGVGPFAIVSAADGAPPDGASWEELAVTPGRYYVDGVLASAPANPAVASPGAWPLADQPHLRTIGAGVAANPGLAEPADDGRYAAFLDVRDHLVTADERPQLLESALGGPDTAAREQTVWQVRLEPVAADTVCSQVPTAQADPRRMVASLQEADDDVDPCRIVGGGGYQRLENQLYRVEVFDVEPTPRFVWSRENGSVVTGLLDLDVSTVPGADAALTTDRPGRDDELSIRQGELVEVTSSDRRLRGEPGFLGTVASVVGLVLHVAWDAGAPTSVAALGRAPVVRRWDGGPSPLRTTSTDLEGGIVVRFPAEGTPRVGDYWLVPARTARLAFGVTARQGTLEWPWDSPSPDPQPPDGPERHRARLAVLDRTGGTWTQVSDCRSLFPPLTGLAALDLVGGDGQEAMPGDELDEAVRVVVRKGAVPVAGAPVRFTADGGTLRDDASGDVLGAAGTVLAGPDGVAAVRWTLDPGGGPTQTVTSVLLDDTDTPTGAAVVVTGRLSVAREVAWDPVCDGFAGTRTVQDALAQVVTTRMLRLLGGDGQEVGSRGRTVPRLVRVVVDSPCGPVRARVVARGRDGARVLATDDGAAVPGSLPATATEVAVAGTDDAGVAAFAWQPVFDERDDDGVLSDTLTIGLDGSARDGVALVQVSAQLDVAVGRTSGLHVVAVTFRDGTELVNDTVVAAVSIASGLVVELDGAPLPDSVDDKPVGRVLVDLPWPTPALGNDWALEQSFGTQTITLDGTLAADGRRIVWQPPESLRGVLEQVRDRVLDWQRENRVPQGTLPLRLRFQLDGWAVVDARNPELHLNGQAVAVSERGSTRLRLPTTDEVTGGRFETWFWFGRPPIVIPPVIVDAVVGRTRAFAERRALDAGLVVRFEEVDAPGVRGGTVVATEPPEGAELRRGELLTIRVARGVGG
ncbi:PASTA domain-containing protein [Cellulosimicrobium terreum]|nr:PASTA domain-containing protein [Cellulosimicrobium terreum]